MKLKECMEIGEKCGLYSIEECYDNIVLHNLCLFKCDDILIEIEELQKDIFYNYPELFLNIFQRRKRFF